MLVVMHHVTKEELPVRERGSFYRAYQGVPF